MLRERELVQIKKRDKWTKGECNSNWSKRRKEIIGPKKNELRIGPNKEKRKLDQRRTYFELVQSRERHDWTIMIYRKNMLNEKNHYIYRT